MHNHNIIFLLTGNKLACDCRLSWLHKLRNETRSRRVKASLERLNCIMDTKLKTNLGNIKIENTDLKVIKQISDKIDDEDDNFDDVYDEMQDQDNGNDVSKREYRRKLMEIPVDMLPCANKLSYEASYSPPTQDEVKYYKTSGANSLENISISLIIFLILVKVL